MLSTLAVALAVRRAAPASTTSRLDCREGTSRPDPIKSSLQEHKVMPRTLQLALRDAFVCGALLSAMTRHRTGPC